MCAAVLNEKEILTKVTQIISEITMMEINEIDSASSLIDDLGMESIDFLDLTFKLEQTFNIEIPRTNPIQRISNLIGPELLMQDDKLTEEGVKFLKLIFPETDPSLILVGLLADNIPSLITVQTYVHVVKRGLEIAAWKPDECDKCRKIEFKEIDKGELEFPDDIVPLGPAFICISCENIMLAPSFDMEICQKMGIDIEQEALTD